MWLVVKSCLLGYMCAGIPRGDFEKLCENGKKEKKEKKS